MDDKILEPLKGWQQESQTELSSHFKVVILPLFIYYFFGCVGSYL